MSTYKIESLDAVVRLIQVAAKEEGRPQHDVLAEVIQCGGHLLKTGAVLDAPTTGGYMLKGYAADGSDLAPYLPVVVPRHCREKVIL